MHGSRSESSLLGRSHGAGVRLTPVRSPAAWGDEKQQQQAQQQPPLPVGGPHSRVVDPLGRPLGMPDPFGVHRADPFTPPRPAAALRIDKDGLPRISVLSGAGLRGTEGDMSSLLRERVLRTSSSDLALLAVAKGSPAAGSPSKKHAAHAKARASKAARAAVSPSAAAASAAAAAAAAGSIPAAPVRLSDFSTDGGMGGQIRTTTLSMTDGATELTAMSTPNPASPLAQTAQGRHTHAFTRPASGTRRSPASSSSPSSLYSGPPHVSPLSSSVGVQSNAALQAQVRGLDLLSTAFGQLIAEIGGSRGNLSRLLLRVKDNYRLLFGNLIDSLMHMQGSYHTALQGCVADYKALQISMDNKVSHLEHRVRLLTQVSASKDSIIGMGEDAVRGLEEEVAHIKAEVLQGVKGATLKVEQASNAIIQDSERQYQARMAGGAAGGGGGLGIVVSSPDGGTTTANSGAADVPGGGDGEGSNGGGDSSTFSNGSSVDALTQLSLESRSLTYELSELIQNVAWQSDKSAVALEHLDRLLDQGARDVGHHALVQDAAVNVATAMAGAGVLPAAAAAINAAAGAPTSAMSVQVGGGGLSSPVPPSPYFAPSPLAGQLAMHIDPSSSPNPAGTATAAATPSTAAPSPLAATAATSPLPAPLQQFPEVTAMSHPFHTRGNASSGSDSLSSSSFSLSPLHPFLSHRPSTGELRSSSRWQFLRHQMEETPLESKWTSATQTDESATGYVALLSLQPVNASRQWAAALAEAKGAVAVATGVGSAARLQDVSSVSVILPESVRDAEEQQQTDSAAASADTLSSLGTGGPSYPLRAYPLRINGFILPAALRDFMAPVFGLLDSRGQVRVDEGWDEGPLSHLGQSDAPPTGGSSGGLPPRPGQSASTSRHLPHQRPSVIDTTPVPLRSPQPNVTRSTFSSGEMTATGGYSGGGRGSGSGVFEPLSGGGSAVSARASYQSSTRRSLRRSNVSSGDLTIPPAASATPPPVLTPSPRPHSRRGSLLNAASLPNSHPPLDASPRTTTLIGHDLSARPAPVEGPVDPAAALSPLIFVPLMGGKRRASGIVGGTLDSSRRGSDTFKAAGTSPRPHHAPPYAGEPLSPPFLGASLAPAPLSLLSPTASPAPLSSSAAQPITPMRSPFKEPTTAEQLNPARLADENRFATTAAAPSPLDADGSLPASALAEFHPPMSVRDVFDTVYAVYALHVANSTFAAGGGAAAATSSPKLAALGGPGISAAPAPAPSSSLTAISGPGLGIGLAAVSTDNGLCELLLEHAVEVSGSVSRAPHWLGSFLAALLGLYAKSELLRHFAHFIGLVHGNVSGGGIDALDFTSSEGVDMYARLLLCCLRSRSVRSDPAAHAPFDYVGDLTPLGPREEDAFPPHSFIPSRTAELLASELLSPLSVRTPGVGEVLARVLSWIRANVRTPPHPKLPPHRAQTNHVPLAAFVLRTSREWRMHVRAIIQQAAKKTAAAPTLSQSPKLGPQSPGVSVSFRESAAAATSTAGGSGSVSTPAAAIDLRGGGDVSLAQWRLFLRGVNAPVTDALSSTRPHVLPALLRHFARGNRTNVTGEWQAVYAALVPLIRQAGFIAIHTQHIM